MVNKVVALNENTTMYNELVNEVKNASDDALVIVARSYKNREDAQIEPIAVKNGIYFYLAYELSGKTAFLGNTTPEMIYKAKQNMVRRARIGTAMTLLYAPGYKIEDFEVMSDPMNVVTLDNKMYGGGLLYCEEFIKEVERKIGKCYILPSSIHELIFVPAAFADKDDLTAVVRWVNEIVDENEYLADVAFDMDEWI